MIRYRVIYGIEGWDIIRDRVFKGYDIQEDRILRRYSIEGYGIYKQGIEYYIIKKGCIDSNMVLKRQDIEGDIILRENSNWVQGI